MARMTHYSLQGASLVVLLLMLKESSPGLCLTSLMLSIFRFVDILEIRLPGCLEPLQKYYIQKLVDIFLFAFSAFSFLILFSSKVYIFRPLLPLSIFTWQLLLRQSHLVASWVISLMGYRCTVLPYLISFRKNFRESWNPSWATCWQVECFAYLVDNHSQF